MRTILALSVAFAVSIGSAPAGAQQLSSPFGTVTQRVDSTTISVEYYRPSARGRRIFGALVRHGELWTPGANWATTFEVNRDVRIGGQPLPAGKYSIWMIPGPASWTVEADEMLIFRFEGGRAAAFEIKALAENRVLARGVRTSPP